MKNLKSLIIPVITVLSTSAFSVNDRVPEKVIVKVPVAERPAVERTNYLPFFINIKPLGLLFGNYSAEFGLGIDTHWSVGITGTAISRNQIEGGGFGVIGYYHVASPLLSGPFVRFAAERENLNVAFEENSQSHKAKVLHHKGSLTAGYHWAFANGMNLQLSGGVMYLNSQSDKQLDHKVQLNSLALEVPTKDFAGFVPVAELSLGVSIII
jgi:hypothetical protein